MSLARTLTLKSRSDKRGSLVAIEGQIDIPFNIKRVYYIFNTHANVSRGGHAHKNLEQIVICLKGSCRFILDDGKKREEIILDNPTRGLMIVKNTWREMHDFTSDCILMVLASEHYDESDYIRNYQDFLYLSN